MGEPARRAHRIPGDAEGAQGGRRDPAQPHTPGRRDHARGHEGCRLPHLRRGGQREHRQADGLHARLRSLHDADPGRGSGPRRQVESRAGHSPPLLPLPPLHRGPWAVAGPGARRQDPAPGERRCLRQGPRAARPRAARAFRGARPERAGCLRGDRSRPRRGVLGPWWHGSRQPGLRGAAPRPSDRLCAGDAPSRPRRGSREHGRHPADAPGSRQGRAQPPGRGREPAQDSARRSERDAHLLSDALVGADGHPAVEKGRRPGALQADPQPSGRQGGAVRPRGGSQGTAEPGRRAAGGDVRSQAEPARVRAQGADLPARVRRERARVARAGRGAQGPRVRAVMAEIHPFRGLMFRANLDPARVLAPPYDVIPEGYRQELLLRHDRNVVRLILVGTAGDAGYEEAGAAFTSWRADGTLVQDSDEALYVLEQTFEHEGRALVRRGLLARFRAEAPDRGRILPHEHTRARSKEDRWRMLLATRANFSPIFMMVEDPARALDRLLEASSKVSPARAYRDDRGVQHKLWRVTEPPGVRAYQDVLASARAYIADGHHRYATALRYRDAHGSDGALTLGYFTPVGAPGLLVLPYHRIVSVGPDASMARTALDGPLRLAKAPSVAEAARLTADSAASHAFALAWPSGELFVAESQPAAEGWVPADEPASLRALDTFFVHRGVLPRLGVGDDAVGYVHSLAEAEEAVSRGGCALAVLMRGTPVSQIIAVADARESMPAKSTFFHPKLPSGLVIHPLTA